VSNLGLGHGLWPATLAAVICATLGVPLLVAPGGVKELRAQETWGLAALLGVMGFVIAATHLVAWCR